MKILLVMNGSRERYAGGADEARLRVWLPYCAPGTRLELGYLPGEAESGGVSREYAFGTGEAVRNHAQLYPQACVQAERDGYDAVIMHCCSDPGLEQARSQVRIPVVGPGEATLRAGAMIGRRIGMTVPSDKAVRHHEVQVAGLGLADHVVGIEPINFAIGPYAQQDPRAMTDAAAAAAQKLIDRGADVICPSGLAFVPVRVSAAELSERLGVPVMNPPLIAMRTAETLVDATAAAMANGWTKA